VNEGRFTLDHSGRTLMCEYETGLLSMNMGQVFLPLVGGGPFGKQEVILVYEGNCVLEF